MAVSTIVVLLVLALLVVYVITVYNGLVARRNRFKNAFAQIEVQLKRRYDLIPNLVETAKAYLKHERDTLEAVTAARNAALAGLKAVAAEPGNPQHIAQLGQAEGALSSAMGRLNLSMEAYPDLKASQNMQQLSEELTSTENKVSFARQAFNDTVMDYNSYKQSFPPVILAGLFGHGADASLLQFADSALIQEAPKVAF
ncbi:MULTISPECIES: LemA family protein [Pseudomonas]|uniref:LemA protein n=1 Tax=Pseudomonas chlororaphis subsp. aureofaciens TaxID=587851 RepID=A0AAD0ZHL8_9PSED|nr:MULTISPECIES: LemA family protein [Pseudomonas]AZD85402.1 LemA protein [Pseudomonas chlororaphis subsp. aureofaciens]AZD91850.1 LemA protein [Pseudomonas chlororaphis subsp. aureofaciens]AZD98332.1 LemA protein [Pseudomonas chlororaphis subsp. aureofaciens]AZE22886.1 LemA protein [Pseudomonas chlororaphis subsp. aureofaciens]AZE29174.1 LemA protein [Pseudomonas chlororaphis subsp. aureofaciens]